MEKTRHFKELIVWQKAHQFVLKIYKLTKHFPKEELFGLTSQLRRSAVSVPGNIAEGYRKRTIPDKAKFLNTAQGSLDESHYYLILAHDLEYADTADLQADLEEIARLLNAYYTAVNSQR
ncbi:MULTISPECIES: four helix bundle protein [unclassified Spirosoma]|uniref:four helix bundle protein n=1 Tax=unclassified Spirosoma TaxID=2621999 RepID=UPI00095E0582|nr:MULTISPECIES: four helix bundle protein [unclassified Spirosoma]MBN8824654.1 four helix bundle protein [Spirosoma sp.]OJW78794.1 MAG: four helix bundle protein [Spirosoma sp. 48-14]